MERPGPDWTESLEEHLRHLRDLRTVVPGPPLYLCAFCRAVYSERYEIEHFIQDPFVPLTYELPDGTRLTIPARGHDPSVPYVGICSACTAAVTARRPESTLPKLLFVSCARCRANILLPGWSEWANEIWRVEEQIRFEWNVTGAADIRRAVELCLSCQRELSEGAGIWPYRTRPEKCSMGYRCFVLRHPPYPAPTVYDPSARHAYKYAGGR